MRLWLQISLILLIAAVYDVYCRGNRPNFRSSSRKYKSSFSSLKTSSGLSLREKLALATGGLAAAYIGFRMASHRDISRYTVCKGERIEVDPMGVQRRYQYTVCPTYLRYCCRSELYEGERCCAGRSYHGYGGPRGTIIGSLMGAMLFLVGIGLIVYFCCIRRNKRPVTEVDNDFDESQPNSPRFVTVGGFAPGLNPNVPTYPVPVSKPDAYPNVPPPPYNPTPAPPYPGNPPPAYLPYPVANPASRPENPPVAAPGSGWNASAPPSDPPPSSAPYPSLIS